MKNINEDIVFSIRLVDIKNKTVLSLEYEKMGRGYNKLKEHQDYEVYTDKNTIFIKIMKKLESGGKHHMKVNVLESSGDITEWITLFQPKGLITLRKDFRKKTWCFNNFQQLLILL